MAFIVMSPSLVLVVYVLCLQVVLVRSSRALLRVYFDNCTKFRVDSGLLLSDSDDVEFVLIEEKVFESWMQRYRSF